MRQLVVIEFLTLDGVMQGLGSPDEDRDGGFDHGGWAAGYGDDVLAEAAAAGMADTTGYLFGRRTYDSMAAFWPHLPDTNPMAAHLTATPKYVATRTPAELTWRNAQVLEGDLASSVAGLLSQGTGTLAVMGSGVLVQELIAHDLVDGYRLFVHPLLLGTGKRLFRGADRPQRLRLESSTTTTTGVLLLDYAVVRADTAGA